MKSVQGDGMDIQEEVMAGKEYRNDLGGCDSIEKFYLLYPCLMTCLGQLL